jgi:hypothetical protein
VYAEVLRSLPPQLLTESFYLALSKYAFMPKPAEILNCSREILEQRPRSKGSAVEDCEQCRGTGWKLIPRADGNGNHATACDCRSGNAAAG